MSQKFMLAHAGVLLFSIVLAGPAGAQGVLMQRDVSLDMGIKIATEAVAECAKTGSSISVAVVDRVGRLRVFMQGDKSQPHNIELAQRKAYTALTFRRTSAEWAERTGQPGTETAGQRNLNQVIAQRGGVPIKIGEDTIGAVGVSGSNNGGNGDEACAKAGIAKVAEVLK